ncbi:MAG TPA: hypothetical protein DDW67_07190 [Elusimicrobia bacterium]|jgi:hypothetical protein|nr:hypothetical protein [Elusimicrobiota bacterium]
MGGMMKGMLIAVLAIMAAAAPVGAVDFDGGSGSGGFALDLREAMASPVPEVPLPARPLPVFSAEEVGRMDARIMRAIDYVRVEKKGVYLEAGFECLLRRGTPEQKMEFLSHDNKVPYALPEGCSSTQKGICDWVVDTVCTTVTVIACVWVCTDVVGQPATGDNPQECRKECHEEARQDCKEVKNWLCSD